MRRASMFTSGNVLRTAIALAFFSPLPARGVDELEEEGRQRSPVRFSLTETRSPDEPYRLSLQAFETEYNLTLRRPEDSVFGDEFSAQNPRLRSEALEMESTIFEDPKVGAVLQLVPVGSRYEFRGWVNGMGIHFENGTPVATRADPRTRRRGTCGTKPKKLPKEFPRYYEEQPKPMPEKAFIETTILVEDRLLKQIAKRNLDATTYFAIMGKAANLFFLSVTSPRYQIRIVNVFSLSPEQEMDIFRRVNFDPVLEDLGRFVQRYQVSFGNPDVVGLFTGYYPPDPTTPEGSRTEGQAVSISGACQGGRSGSLTVDVGATWNGLDTFAHELGHTLGANHDFIAQFQDKRYDECITVQSAEKSFLMGYDGITRNQFYFSKCSSTSLRQFYDSNAGSCLRRTGSKGLPPGDQLPGENLPNMRDQCVAKLREAPGVELVLTSADEKLTSCVTFSCKYRLKGEPPEDVYSKAIVPQQGTPCDFGGKSGMCQRGDCI